MSDDTEDMGFFEALAGLIGMLGGLLLGFAVAIAILENNDRSFWPVVLSLGAFFGGGPFGYKVGRAIGRALDGLALLAILVVLALGEWLLGRVVWNTIVQFFSS